MKKLFVLSVILTLLAASASAQGPGNRNRIEHRRIERGFNDGQITRPERFRLQNDHRRFEAEKRRSFRDGRITPGERRRLHHMKRHERRETFRFKHNGRRRLV